MGWTKFVLTISSFLAIIFPNASLAVEDLKLTPLIRAGDLEQGRERALNNINLSGIKSSFNKSITSYSGYLTINEAHNSNLFFWLIPAIENPTTAPVILFVNSVMGTSFLQTMFLESGPFLVSEKLELQEREFTWARRHTLIYIDAPLGTGFSFTDSEKDYASTAQDDDEEVYEAMKQIYTLFPEYKARDLYFAGSGIAGRVIPRMVETFMGKGVEDKFEFKLKGIILGSPFVAPKLQVKYSDVLLELGLIDQAQSNLLVVEEKKLQELSDSNKYLEAAQQQYKIHLAPGSLATKLTGFSVGYNFLHTQLPPGISHLEKFIDSKQVHNYLHIGLHKFTIVNQNILAKFTEDIGHTDIKFLEKAVDSGIRVLIYAPQFDMLVPRASVERVIQALEWKGKADFEAGERQIWKVDDDDDVAGYVKTGGNLTYVMLRNAGFWAVLDQPKWTYEMIHNFTSSG